MRKRRKRKRKKIPTRLIEKILDILIQLAVGILTGIGNNLNDYPKLFLLNEETREGNRPSLDKI